MNDKPIECEANAIATVNISYLIRPHHERKMDSFGVVGTKSTGKYVRPPWK